MNKPAGPKVPEMGGNTGGFNFAALYNRPQDAIAGWNAAPAAQAPIDYSDYGYVPGVAQALQATPPTNFVKGQSYFSQAQLAFANWFTTRVHLSPLGKVE